MRRARGAPGGTVVSVAPVSFSIPLKSTSKPVAFPASFEKHIALEFAMRYLFEIGATPTVSNCRAVLKEMPLESCSVTAAWRSRGGLADAIIIQPNGQKCGGGGGGSDVGGKGRGCGGAKIGDAPPPPSLESPLKSSGAHAAPPGAGSGTGESMAPPSLPMESQGSHRTGRPLAGSRAGGTQPLSSMGRASPHKVSVFVDTVSSALGPCIADTRAMALQPASRGSTKNTPANGGNTANERNTAGRGGINDDLRDNTSKSTSRRRAPQQQQPQRLHGWRTVVERGVPKSRLPLAAGDGDGDEDMSGESVEERGQGLSGEEETQERDEMALAEARRKLLDPPKVDMAAVAAVQSGFARKFPFQKHGEKFAEASVRSSVKKLITSDGPARLIGLLTHYLYWVILHPFALACKERDDAFLLELERRSWERMSAGHAPLPTTPKPARTNSTAAAAPAATAPPAAATAARRVPAGQTSARTNNSPSSPAQRKGNFRSLREHPEPGAGGRTVGGRDMEHGGSADGDMGTSCLRAELTPDEAEELFVAVVEAWSSMRASLGTSCGARLSRLPVAVAAIRNGVQTVLCNCYPFLERGGRQGKHLLNALHEEVAAKFIPPFYYEGRFTSVSEEEEEEKNLERRRDGQASQAPPPRSWKPKLAGAPATVASSAGEPTTRANFLDMSPTLTAARHLQFGVSGCNGSSTAEMGGQREAPHVIGGNTRMARDKPGDTRRPGEALFATSTTLRYVFPNPRSPEARRMIASRARARSSRHASNTCGWPSRTSATASCPAGSANAEPTAHVKLAAAEAARDSAAGVERPRASTAGAPTRNAWRGGDDGRNSPHLSCVRQTAATATPGARRSRSAMTSDDRVQGHDVGEQQRQTISHEKLPGYPCPGQQRSAEYVDAATPNHQQQHENHKNTAPPPNGSERKAVVSPSRRTTDDVRKRSGRASRLRAQSISGSAVDPESTFGVAWRTSTVRVGSAAKARLYRGYCEQRGGDYDREYRRHGGKETLTRRHLLTR